jgi:hydrogenase 3 maturation protease
MDAKKSLPNSWQDCLRQKLKQYRPADRPLRLAVLGVGNELRSDDAAGVLVVRRLLGPSGANGAGKPGGSQALILEGGIAPESQTGPLRRFQPDLALLVDAAQMNEPPGSVRCFGAADIAGITTSTHTLPLHLLCRYLAEELNAGVALIGIQPATTELQAGTAEPQLTAVVATAVAAVTAELRAVLIALGPQTE